MVNWINEISSIWAYYVLLMTVQNCLFLAGILLLLYMFRNHDARLLRSIALIGLAKLFIPPFIAISGSSVESITSSNLANTLYSLTITSPANADYEAVQDAAFSYHSILMVGWSLLVLLLIGYAIVKFLRLRAIIKYSKPLNCDKYLPAGTKKKIAFFKSSRIQSPLVVGFLHHKIIFPETWDTWSSDCRKAVIAHEIAHIRQYDHWINMFQIAAQAIHFFNPVVWIHNRKLRFYNDMACDDAAIKSINLSPVHYSQFLVNIAENYAQPHYKHASMPAFFNSHKHLKNRITYQLSKKEGLVMKKMRLVHKAVVCVVAFAIVPFSWYFTKDVINAQPTMVKEAIQKNMVYSEIAQKGGTDIVKVVINASGVVFVDGEITPFSSIKEKIQKYLKENEDSVISLSMDENTEYGFFTEVLNQIKQAGAKRISIAETIDTTKEKVVQSGRDTVKVLIDASGGVLINGERAPVSLIKEKIQEILKKNENTVISIFAFNKTEYGFFSEVLDWIKQAGAKHITIGTIDNVFKIKYSIVEYKTEDIPAFLPIEDSPKIIGGWEQLQKLIKYPEIAKIAGIEGKVTINVLVDEKGEPVKCEVLQSDLGKSGCNEAAIEAIMQLRFEPATMRGQPVKLWMAIPVKFQLKKEKIIEEDIPAFLPIENQPKIIGGWEQLQKLIKYPEIAKIAGIEGKVTINVLVDEKGEPVKCEVLQSDLGKSGCNEAAIEAIMQLRFEPATMRGQPVKFWMAIPVKFQLKKEKIIEEDIPAFLPIENQPKIIGGWEQLSKLIVYPQIAKIAGIEGKVIINVLVNENGEPVDFKVIESNEELEKSGCNEAAIEAIMQLRFKPAKMREKPVNFWMAIPVKFQIKSGVKKQEEIQEKTVDLTDAAQTGILTKSRQIVEKWPDFPDSEKKKGHQGVISFKIRVDENGNVTDAQVLSNETGSKVLEELAKNAALQCKFQPARDNKNRPIAVWTTKSYVFTTTIEQTEVKVPPRSTVENWPKFPDSEKKKGHQGIISFKILVDENGNVTDAQVLSNETGSKILEELAKNAALQSKFQPARDSKNKPIAVWTTKTFEFTIKDI